MNLPEAPTNSVCNEHFDRSVVGKTENASDTSSTKSILSNMKGNSSPVIIVNIYVLFSDKHACS